MTAISHGQAGTRTERGHARGAVCASASDHRLTHRPAIGGPRALSNSRQLTTYASVGSLTSLDNAGQLDRSLGIGRIFFSDRDLCEEIAFGRAGAFVGCRPQFLRTARHIRQDIAEPSETHDRGLSSPLVAVEANHRPKGFRVVRTAFREAGNVIRS